MEIGDWLRLLGLSRYEAAFRENSVDLEVLPKLTAEDLKDLGVVSVGHRRKLLAAIECLGSAAVAAPTLARPEARIGNAAAAERRHLTVMIVDLAGSTALAERLDPEDMRTVLAAYHACCSGLIEANGGFVAKYMGDGALAYFGYPQAHEHDAENAVLAALAIVAAAPKLDTPAGAPLHVRVGVATGLVVVGDLLGSGEAQERGVVGDTPNLAARLQAIAEPDGVVISAGTRELLGNLFELRDLGLQDLKGIARPARAFAALRAGAVPDHFEALHGTDLGPLVGREEECDLLLRRWAKARGGEGQVVMLSGEAGIGKSRLAATLVERLAGEPLTPLRYFCSPQHTDDALFPFVGAMERAARFVRDDAPRAKLDKLEALLAGTSTPAEDAALVADMLSLDNDGRYPALDLAPPQRRQETLRALAAQIEALTRNSPVLMIFEDAHWADPTSLAALERIVNRIRTLRALLLVTFRPEFDAPWTPRSHVTALNLNRLGERETGALIGHVAGAATLPAAVRKDIAERSDGVPLFAEEMTKAVLEADGDRETAAAGRAMAVPATLQASLTARLDRLGPAKEVAQVGAAIGREFPHALLAAVARKPEEELLASLDRLVAAGLMFRSGAPPNATYRFKHALVQDAAYDALLREPRRSLHARIVEAFESRFAGEAERQPALLARHSAEAGLIEKAAILWNRAGERSLERSAFVEAAEQFSRAVDGIGSLPSTPALRREQIRLQVALTQALAFAKGHSAPEARAAAERARALAEQAQALGEEPPSELSSLHVGNWAASFSRFDGDACRDLAAQILTLGEKQGNLTLLLAGHYFTGMSLAVTGDVADGNAHFDRVIALYDPVAIRPFGTRIPLDYRIAALAFRSVALWCLGYPEAAVADGERALAEARELGQALTLINALSMVAWTHFHLRDYATARAVLAECVALAGEKGTAWYTAAAALFGSFVSAASKESADHVHAIAAAWDGYLATGATRWAPIQRSYLAAAYADVGQYSDARRCIAEATATAEATRETWFEAEIYRIAGEIELAAPERDAAKAEAQFQRALAVARAQQARSWELRGAASLARLWLGQGERQKAHDLLAPVYAWFTEGFDTPDLKQAKALLEELVA